MHPYVCNYGLDPNLCGRMHNLVSFQEFFLTLQYNFYALDICYYAMLYYTPMITRNITIYAPVHTYYAQFYAHLKF